MGGEGKYPPNDGKRVSRSEKRILAFAGRNGSGKGTASELTASLLGAPRHTYSDVLYEFHAACGIPRETVGRATLQELSTVVRRWFDQDALARVMVAKCLAAPSAYIVIDGVRRPEDLDLLFREFGRGNVIVLWIEASSDIRHGRVRERKTKAGEAFMPWEQFDREERAETESQLDHVRALCVREIDNNGTLQALEEQIKVVHHDFIIGPVA